MGLKMKNHIRKNQNYHLLKRAKDKVNNLKMMIQKKILKILKAKMNYRVYPKDKVNLVDMISLHKKNKKNLYSINKHTKKVI